jgi:hypothetical protein
VGCERDYHRAVFYNIKNYIKKIMKDEYNENIEPSDSIISVIFNLLKKPIIDAGKDRFVDINEMSKLIILVIKRLYNKPKNYNGIETTKQLIKNLIEIKKTFIEHKSIYGIYDFYPLIQENGLLNNTFGKNFKVKKTKISDNPLKYSEEIDFDNVNDTQTAKFIAMYPYDDLTTRTIIDDIIEEFNNFIKKYNNENNTQIEWNDVFMTIGSDFEIKKGITARLCEQSDNVVALPNGTYYSGIALGNDRYYPAVFNKIHKKFDEYLTINKLIISKNIDGLNNIPNLYEYIEDYQLEKRYYSAKCIDCKAIKDKNNNVIIQYIIEKEVNNEKQKLIREFSCSEVHEFKLVNEYRDKTCKVYDDKETFIYDFEKIETTNIEEVDVDSYESRHTKTPNSTKFANQLIEFIKKIGKDEISDDNKLILHKSFKALAPYPQSLHYVYINTIEYNIFRYINYDLFAYIVHFFFGMNYVYEEYQYEYYEHPFSELCYRYDDDYPALSLPKRIKYINIVVDMYNVIYCNNNTVKIYRKYV